VQAVGSIEVCFSVGGDTHEDSQISRLVARGIIKGSKRLFFAHTTPFFGHIAPLYSLKKPSCGQR
jgi:hypothetical protein